MSVEIEQASSSAPMIVHFLVGNDRIGRVRYRVARNICITTEALDGIRVWVVRVWVRNAVFTHTDGLYFRANKVLQICDIAGPQCRKPLWESPVMFFSISFQAHGHVLQIVNA